MAPIRFECPFCHISYEVDSAMAGAKARCHGCEAKFIVPDSDGFASPADPATPQPAPEEPIPTPRPRQNPRTRQTRPDSPSPTRKKRSPALTRNPRKKNAVPRGTDAKPAPPEKKKNPAPFIVASILLIALGIGFWVFWKQRGGRPVPTQTASTTTTPDSASAPSAPRTSSITDESTSFQPVPSDALSPATTRPKASPAMPTMPNKPTVKNTEYAMSRYLEFKSPKPPSGSLTADLPLDGSFKNLADPSRPATRRENTKGIHIYVDGIRGKAIRLKSRHGISNCFKLPPRSINNDAGAVTMWIRNGVALGTMWGLSVFQTVDTAFKWSEHLYRWRLSMFGSGPLSGYSMPNRHEWLHLAIVWDRKRNFQRLYLNGELTNYASSLSIPEKSPKLPDAITFSTTVGHPDRYMDLDEIKVYDRALSSSEIKAMVEDFFPVRVPLREIPESYLAVSAPPGQTKTFKSKVVLDGKKTFKGTLKLETLDATDKTLWTKNVDFSLSPEHKEAPLEWEVPIPRDGSDVAYVKATLTGYKAKPAWSVEITRAARDTSPANLNGRIQVGKKVVDINCSAKPSRDLYLDNCGARVVSTGIGKYRETSKKAFSFFSYRFDIKRAGWPHILRITYPDDKPRVFSLDLNAGEGPPQGAGVQTGYMTRLTKKMKTQDVLFWPSSTACLLTACNWGEAKNNNKGSVLPFHGETAALARIEVFELKDKHLPPIGMVKPKGLFPRRDIGMWMEDASLENYWNQCPKDDRTNPLEWARRTRRFAEYMDYIGVGIFQYPVVWYTDPLFQSHTLMRFTDRTDRLQFHPKGVFATFTATLASKGMKFFPIFYFRELAALLLQTDSCEPTRFGERVITPAHWNERYRTRHPGGDDMFQYYWNGKFKKSPYGASGTELPMKRGTAPVFNPIHPDVLKIERGMFKDWIDAYADNPGFGGILLDLGLSWGGLAQADSFTFGRIYGGYGDYTVRLFEKETGIKVPGKPDDPKRYRKRYDFLTSGAMRKKWIDWRCRQIRDKVVMPLFRMLRSKRSDLVLQIGIGSNYEVGSEKVGAKISWKKAARECGIDVDLYKNIPGITIIRHGVNSQNVTKCYPCDNLDESWPLDNGIATGVCSITSSYWELGKHGDVLNPAKEKWPEAHPNQQFVRVIIDAREGILAHTAYAMMKKDIGELYIGGMGYPATLGHENILRPFFRAFRSLPKVKFDDIPGLEDPVRGRQKTVAGATYAYLVNAEPYAIPVELTFSSPPGEVVRLGTLTRGDVKKKSFAIEVPPYQMVAIRFAGDSKITRGVPHVPQKEIDAVMKWKDALKKKDLYPLKLHPPEKAGKHYIWFEAEDWDAWKTKERFSSKTCHSIDEKNIKFISGNADIAFGGGGIPTVYKLRCPKPGRYALWVRYTAPATNPPTKWTAKIDGGKVGETKTPTDWKNIWEKVGDAEIARNQFTLEWFHQAGHYSSPVDCFMLTDDPSYIPKGPADYKKRERTTRERYGYLERLIEKGHLAEARALLTVLQAAIERKGGD